MYLLAPGEIVRHWTFRIDLNCETVYPSTGLIFRFWVGLVCGMCLAGWRNLWSLSNPPVGKSSIKRMHLINLVWASLFIHSRVYSFGRLIWHYFVLHDSFWCCFFLNWKPAALFLWATPFLYRVLQIWAIILPASFLHVIYIFHFFEYPIINQMLNLVYSYNITHRWSN